MSDVIKISYDKIPPIQIQQLFQRLCKLEAEVKACCAAQSTIINNSNFSAVELKFIVGYTDAPAQNSDASFILVDDLGVPFLNRKINFYREGEYQTEGEDYTYDPTIGQITVMPILKDKEAIMVEIYPANFWRIITLGTEPVINQDGEDVLINETDAILINGTDKLEF